MTLVVGKQKGKILALVSDTGIEHNGERLGFDQQIPKIAILNKNLAVAFAGSQDLAINAIKMAPKHEAATYGEIIQHFVEAHEANERAVDFILAFGAPLFKLAKISEGVVRQGRSVEWIGDHAGFSAFQEFRAKRVDPTIPFIAPKLHSLRKSEMKSPCFDMIGTMRNVIAQADVQGVFGHPVAASNLENVFEFVSYGISLEENTSFKSDSNIDLPKLAGQLAEARSYAFSCFISSPNDRTRAIAFHYMRGKITYVHFGAPSEPLTNFVRLDGLNVIELQQRLAPRGKSARAWHRYPRNRRLLRTPLSSTRHDHCWP